MITIISSTNRPNSNTLIVSKYYQSILNNLNIENRIIDLCDLPGDFTITALYDERGKNPAFNHFIELVNTSDKFVFVVPEYNGSFPGVLKAFIDGLDFPLGFRNKKCGLIGISSGVMAGTLALSHLTDILNYLGMHVLALKPRLPRIEKILVNNSISDAFLDKMLHDHAKAMIEF